MVAVLCAACGSTSSTSTRVVTQHSSGPPAPSPSIYVAQDTAGSGSGTSCANAHSTTWFNNVDHWGTEPGQIGPGIIVGLCGTISSPLVAQSSGTSTDPITIYWEPNASLSEPYCPGREQGCFNTNHQKYLVLNGGSNGSILSTANGTTLPNHQNNVVGIWAIACTGCVIENLNISNMYVHTSPTDTHADDDTGIYVSGSNNVIAHNTIHDNRDGINATWTTSDGRNAIFGNDFYRDDAGLNSVVNGESGGSIGPILFYGNNVHDYSNWDTRSDAYHHDGIHCWTSDNGRAAHYNGFYIYNNRFAGPTDLPGSPYGDNITAQIFLEGPGNGTPCTDGSSPIWLFNNVLTATTYINGGLISANSGRASIYNNTFIGSSPSAGVCLTSTGGTVANNLVTSCGTLVGNGNSGNRPSPFTLLDYNVYANGGHLAWVWGSQYLPFSAAGFASWKASTTGDSHSAMVPSVSAPVDAPPQNGSPAFGAGTNLTSLCTGDLIALCEGIGGASRPKTGDWSAGAY